MLGANLLRNKQANLRERVSNVAWLKYRPSIMAIRIFRAMWTRDANHLAAGVAYYAIFALFPFVLGVMVISDLFGSDLLQKAFLEFVIGNLPGSAAFIESNIHEIVQQREALVVIAVVGMLWSSASIFEAMNRVVNRAWGIHRAKPFHISRLRHLLALFIFGLLFFASVTVSYGLQIVQEQDLGIPGIGRLALQFTSWWVSGLTFLLIYRFVPNCRVYWRHIWLGTVTAATLFELGKVAFTWYLLSYGNYDQVYGSIASTIVFLFWMYLSALILSLGAEICAQYQSVYCPGDVEERGDAWEKAYDGITTARPSR